MARKQILTNTVSQYLDHNNQGTLKNRQFQRAVLLKIIDDFYTIRKVPASWFALTHEHVQHLVSFWKKKGLAEGTIMNYLTCFRFFINKTGHVVSGIDNQTLGLKKPRNVIKPAIDTNTILNKIEEPIAYLLFSLQVRFGLTLQEAMHLTPGTHAHEDELWITREISNNHKDRFVPVITIEQKNIIRDLIEQVGHAKSLYMQFGEAHLRRAWIFALSTLKLPTHINYRYLYIKERFVELNQQYSKRDSKKILTIEVGINQTNPIWAGINE